MKKWFVLFLFLFLSCWTVAIAGVVQQGTHSGETVGITELASGITSNSTSGLSVLPPGLKTFWGEVVCSSGACTQTQMIYGAREGSAANGVLLCTITLSGTPRAQDACPPSAAAFPYYYVIATSTSGTGAAGAVYGLY